MVNVKKTNQSEGNLSGKIGGKKVIDYLNKTKTIQGIDGWEEEFKDFWKPLLQTDGKWDEKKISNELQDLVFIFNQVGEVYMYITGGKLSKPMYYAETIKTEFDDAVTEAAEEEIEDRLSQQATALKQNHIANANKMVKEFEEIIGKDDGDQKPYNLERNKLRSEMREKLHVIRKEYEK